jgi:Lrp/AsnC family transcriptional regulator for asnA, asnC and gidA
LKFFPEIDFEKLGYRVYHVFLLIDEKDKQKQAELIEKIKEHKNTLSVIEYSDRWDLEWIVIAKDIEEFDVMIRESLTEFSDVIMERSKLVVITNYYSILLPYDFYNEFDKDKIIVKEKEIDYKIDKKDLKILSILGENSRVSTYEISKKIPLSPDTIGLRIKKLVKAGIIKKFTILVNFSLLKHSWYTFAMQLFLFDKKDESKFKQFIEKHPHIISAIKTLGIWDFLVYITANNPKDFHRTIKQLKKEFSPTLKNYATYVAYKEHIFNAVPKVIN